MQFESADEVIYSCVNCSLDFRVEGEYKLHYKSEHHRYNIKRKLIQLPPLSYTEFLLQFKSEMSEKSSSQPEVFCQICCKRFRSMKTYKQHTNSEKHKERRSSLMKHRKDEQKMSSCSQFSMLEEEEKCLFCTEKMSKGHLREQHNFPPFQEECANAEDLIQMVRGIIGKGVCIYCSQEFHTQDSAKQHMAHRGHAKLNLDQFEPFEPFYIWKIQEESEGETEETKYIDLKAETLKSLETKRLERVEYTKVGVMINGKEFGYRHLRQYYKQYIGRVVPAPAEIQKCLTNQQEKKMLSRVPPFTYKACSISFPTQHR